MVNGQTRNLADPNRVLPSVYDDGYLRVEHDNYYAAIAGERIPLPPKQFLILSCLARKPERVLLSGELWERVWGRNKPANDSNLRVQVHRLRHKLMRFGVTVESMPNIGYRLVLARRHNGKTRRS